MLKFALPLMLYVAQVAQAQSMAKEALLDTPRICRVEKTNFNNLQVGNISYGAGQADENDHRLIKLRWYTEQPYFAFTNAKGINVTHSLNVANKIQTKETKNSVTYEGTVQNQTNGAKVEVIISVREASIRVHLESKILNKSGIPTSTRSFEASCSL